MKNKFLALLTLISFVSLTTNKAYAQDQPPDYEHLLIGECVKSDGFFFSEPGMANLYVAVDEKIKLAVLDKQSEISRLKLDLTKCIDSKQIELNIQRQMFEEQLLIKQKTIDAYKSDAFWHSFQTVAYVVVALGGGILVGKFLLK